MADLPSILGGMAQGFLDFGKSAVDLFGTGGAAVGDLVDTIRTGKVSTKNQDDFRKWLYNTDSVQDAAAKGLGTALNGVQTVTDYIPGIGAVTKNPLFNAGQGALGGLADEFKTYGKDYDLGRAGERAAVSAGAALASGGLGDALKKSANPLLSSGTVQGLARGATGGAITGGGYAAIDGGDIAQSALQGAGTGALIGGATGAMQDFMPRKATYDMALTDDERQARIANAKNMLANEQDPERIAELNNQIKDLGGALANDDMAVNSAPETAAVIAGKNRSWDELYDMLSRDAGAFENEDRTLITASPSQLRSEIEAIDAKYPNDLPDDIWDRRYSLNQQLKAAEKGYNSPYDYYVGESKKNFRQDFESRPDKYKAKIADIESQAQRQAALDQDIANASPRKLAQFNLIQQKNPAPNETLTWIRSPKDILTWDEAIAGAEGDNAFTWPDYTLEDALRDKKKHSMTVYSSYPIKGGTFVTPSRQQASDYAGGGRVYSKVIRPDDVAWINGDEGQYAYTRKK